MYGEAENRSDHRVLLNAVERKVHCLGGELSPSGEEPKELSGLLNLRGVKRQAGAIGWRQGLLCSGGLSREPLYTEQSVGASP